MSQESNKPVVHDTQVSLVDCDLPFIPDEFNAYASFCTNLLINFCQLKKVSNLSQFTKLQVLNLDNNEIEDSNDFPKIESLETLWLNNNKITDNELIMDLIARCFPNVQYLSMMRNPCCPDIYSSDDQLDAYQRYRYYIIYRLGKLNLLDATPVTATERKEAEKRGKFMKVAKPTAPAGEETKEEPVMKAISPIQPGAKPPKVATFLAKGKPRYDGTNSEGNRFICNEDL